MKIISKKNYGKKLESEFYIMILSRNREHLVGSAHEIYVNTKKIHDAKIILSEPVSLSELEDWATLLDVGLSAHEYRQKWLNHEPTIDLDSQSFNIVLFQQIPSKTNEKIALFCQYYSKYSGLKYKITPREIGMIKEVDVTPELLSAFFKSSEYWAKVKSIPYYVRNINELMRISANANIAGYPNVFDKKYLHKLDGPSIVQYYRHLRSLGLNAVKSSTGEILDFK